MVQLCLVCLMALIKLLVPVKALAATTVFENITKRDNSDIFTRTMANNKKTYKPAKSSALTQAEKDLAAFKKMMKEMGLLDGGGNDAISAGANRAAKSMVNPFKEAVKKIKDELTSLHDSLMGAFDITSMGKSGSTISRNMSKLMAKMREFTSLIKQLRQKGLNADLLTQIVKAGPVAGLDAAKALAGSDSLLQQANSSYSEFGMLSGQVASEAIQAKYANQYNITVEGGVGSGATIGKAVVAAIQAFERQSGANWRTT